MVDGKSSKNSPPAIELAKETIKAIKKESYTKEALLNAYKLTKSQEELLKFQLNKINLKSI